MKKILKKQMLGLGVVITLVVLLGYITVKSRNNSNIPGSDNNTVSSEGEQFPGPTEQELRDSEKHKEDLANNNQPPGNTNQKITVTPVITSANVNEVRGYISGVVEDGGTCTATYTKGATSFARTSTGIINVSNTTCPAIKTSRSDFTSTGTWSVVLTYNSPSSQGTSQPVSIEVN